MSTSLLPEGSILQDRYQIVRLLGQGGMGAVYLAHDRRLDHPCAVKETLDVSPQAQQQFGREARLLARLHHPHLPRVTDYFAQTGRYYLVMDYVEGHDLDAWVRNRGPVPPEQAVAWMAQVLDALDYLHSQQPPVIHRDVKPANVKITPAGQAFLVDFGIAKEYHPGRHTVTGARALTPGYAPLEQYAARGETDARSDVYGVGATLYYLLTGVEPVDAIDRAAGARLPSVCEHNPRLRALSRIDGVTGKALALQKADRWPSAAHLRRALSHAVAAAGTQPHSATPRPRPQATRPHRASSLSSSPLVWTLGGAAAALIILLVVLLFIARGPRDSGARATATTQLAVVQIPAQPSATLASSSTNTVAAATPTAIAASATESVKSVAPTATLVATASVPTGVASSMAPTRDASNPAPTNTRRPVATATRTPRPPDYTPIKLTKPDDGDTLSGILTFEWEGVPLQPDHLYDLRFWSKEELDRGDPGRGANPPSDATSQLVNVENLQTIVEHGDQSAYYWGVVIVRVRSGNLSPEVIRGAGEHRLFYHHTWEAPSTPSRPGGGTAPATVPTATAAPSLP